MRTITKLAAVVTASTLAVPATACSAMADTVDGAPVRVLAGSSTALTNPIAVTRGPSGEWYVGTASATINVYAPAATGNATPVRRIAGASTGLSGVYDVAVDRLGYVYATSGTSVRVFAPDATGDVAPVKVIAGTATMLTGPLGIAVRPDGSVAVADISSKAVLQFAPTAVGNTPPVAALQGAATGLSAPTDLAFTPSGRLYVSNAGGSVNVYDRLRDGDVAPSRTIGGLASGLTSAYSIALDDAENVYVAPVLAPKVVVFGAGASGNATPRRVLSGASTQLGYPWGLYVGGDRRLTVADYLTSAVNTYAPLVPRAVVTAPGRVRGLRVGGGSRARKRPITWAAPAGTGGAALVRYDVVVKRRARTVRVAHLAPSRHRYVLRTRALRTGSYRVLVRAVNTRFAGPYASVGLRVRR